MRVVVGPVVGVELGGVGAEHVNQTAIHLGEPTKRKSPFKALCHDCTHSNIL